MMTVRFSVVFSQQERGMALALHVPPPRINDIVREKRRRTADTALRLARYFGTSAAFWMGLQDDYDLKTCQEAIQGALNHIEPRCGQVFLRGVRGGKQAAAGFLDAS